MSTSHYGLTIKQQRVVAELLSGSSITQTAKTVGISRQTIYKYLKKPAVQAVFLQELDISSTFLYGQSMSRVSDAIDELKFGVHFDMSMKALKRIRKTFDLVFLLRELYVESRAVTERSSRY